MNTLPRGQKWFNLIISLLTLLCIINSILAHTNVNSHNKKVIHESIMPGGNPGSGYSGPPPCR